MSDRDAGPDDAADSDRDDAGGGRDAPADGERFGPDPDRVAALREVAEDARGDTDESERVAAMLYRVSDLYDPDEEATPEDVYLNMRTLLRVGERGTLERRRE